ncbi:hypothetical protein [Acidicapsa acidisoli]|uniref:hypothetical protein n=1 Tax=Acidicapsa acidisoli TaxID=1615681 RepID=UPI0021DFF380|nr:hypothetical protein [Acidicapsa acidisoli]
MQIAIASRNSLQNDRNSTRRMLKSPGRLPSAFGHIRGLAVAATLLCSSVILLSQQPPVSSGADMQREAMRKLSFLTGHWSGPVSIVRGPGEPLHLTQTEEIAYKLDGLVLLIEGASRNTEGKTLFSALATVSFDEATHSYRFRAYHDGHYVDTELSVLENGFSWRFASGPAHVVNTMHLTGKGEWAEVTEVTVGSNPPMRSVDMLLQHQP